MQVNGGFTRAYARLRVWTLTPKVSCRAALADGVKVGQNSTLFGAQKHALTRGFDKH